MIETSSVIWSTIVGIGASILSSLSGSYGNILIRQSYLDDEREERYLLENKKATIEHSGYYRKKHIWLFGMFLITAVNSILNIISYYFASSSIIIPLSGLQIIFNYWLSFYYFHENTCFVGKMGIVILFVSMIGIAISGNIHQNQNKKIGEMGYIDSILNNLKDSKTSHTFLYIYALLISLMIFGLIKHYQWHTSTLNRLHLQDEAMSTPTDSPTETKEKQKRDGNLAYILSAAGVSGVIGGGTNILLKFLMIYIKEDTANKYAQPTFIFPAILFLMFAAMQLLTLNVSLKTLPTIQSVSCNSGTLMLTGATASVILLMEELNNTQIYLISFFGMLIGLFLIANGKMVTVDKTDVEGGEGCVMESKKLNPNESTPTKVYDEYSTLIPNYAHAKNPV